MSDDRTLYIDGSEVSPDSLTFQPAWKRPVEVEAVSIPAPFTVETLEGTMEADAGAFLVRGVEGEYYPVEPGIFAQTYTRDESKRKKYSEAEISAAMRELRSDTLRHVPTGVTDTDARAGARALLDLLRDNR